MQIACKPHIVDKQLEKLCLDSAREFVNVVEKLGLLGDSKNGLTLLELLYSLKSTQIQLGEVRGI